MKKFFFSLLFISLLNVEFGYTQKVKNELVGIWEHKGERSSDAYQMGLRKAPPGKYKIINSDGTFINFNVYLPSSVVSLYGTWKTIADTILIESIERSINPSLTGKNNKLIYKIKDKKFLYLKWFLEKNMANKKDDIWIEELWQRVEFPVNNPGIRLNSEDNKTMF